MEDRTGDLLKVPALYPVVAAACRVILLDRDFVDELCRHCWRSVKERGGQNIGVVAGRPNSG